MKYLSPFVLILVIAVSLTTTSCSKDTTTNTVIDTVLVRSVDTVLPMNAKSWNLYSFQTNTLVDSGATTYYTTSEGIKFKGQAYRLGSRIQTKVELGIYSKTLYYKWKANGGGLFSDMVAQLKYDPFSNDGSPAIQGVDLTDFSLNNTFAGSTLIQPDVWYYTRVVPVAGTDNYQVITATGNYNNQGGTVLLTKTYPIYTKSGYIALRMGDPYGGTNAYVVLGECKIASN